jgi:hypothetical protein
MIKDIDAGPDSIGIARDTLAYIVLKARAYDAEVAAVDPDDSSNDADDRAVDILEEGRNSPNGAELRAAIASLDQDARTALVALTWVGRGDFDAEDWEEALAAAAASRDGPTSRYLMGMPLLGDLLEQGADALGIDLTREEQIGMHNPITEQPAEEDRT